MIKHVMVLIYLLLAFMGQANADEVDAIKSPKGYGTKDYVWGRTNVEQREVLKLSGDPDRGKEAFRVCRGCHKKDAGGVTSGAYPRLAGQHVSVVIKQVTEMRDGVRINPKMDPFSDDHAVTLGEIADIAAFLVVAETTRENGKGNGDRVQRGKQLYEESRCVTCHGFNGEGDAQRIYPAIAAQHYGYLTEEMEHIQKGIRGNAHPEMVKAIRSFSPSDIEAVADYLSRLPDYRQVQTKRGTQ